MTCREDYLIVHNGRHHPGRRGRTFAASCSMLADVWLTIDENGIDGFHPEENAVSDVVFLVFLPVEMMIAMFYLMI